MENAGIVRPKHSVAHNIIPEGAVSAEPARKILDKHKIDYNDTINEVLHNGRHPNEYIDAINKRISEADVINGKSGVLKELNIIRDILQRAPRNESWKTILT